jgi:tetratricopeptide (TPR) repeat protein
MVRAHMVSISANTQSLVACYNNMAVCHLKRENWQRAIECGDSVIGMDPDNAKAYFRRGQAQAAMGAWHAATQDYKRAAELSPQDVLIRQALADAREKHKVQ